jgi:hypothetical protein
MDEKYFPAPPGINVMKRESAGVSDIHWAVIPSNVNGG